MTVPARVHPAAGFFCSESAALYIYTVPELSGIMLPQSASCPLCGAAAERIRSTQLRGFRYTCPSCGTFNIESAALAGLIAPTSDASCNFTGRATPGNRHRRGPGWTSAVLRRKETSQAPPALPLLLVRVSSGAGTPGYFVLTLRSPMVLVSR